MITSTRPASTPGGRSSAALGAAYSASGRTRPIFDTFGHDAYPEARRPESPASTGARSVVAVARRGRLGAPDCAALDECASAVRANRLPGQGSGRIWYLRTASRRIVRRDELTSTPGSESDRSARARASRRRQATESTPDRPVEPALERARACLLPARGRRVLQLPSSTTTRPTSAAGSPGCCGPTGRRSPRTALVKRRYRRRRRGPGGLLALRRGASADALRAPRPPSTIAVVLRAVVFDVDFTLARPGPDLGPEGYEQLGLRYGLELDPARYERRAPPRSQS